MLNRWSVLVASSHAESRGALASILNGLSVNVIACSGLQQAEEVLSRESVPLVFCDEVLSDGSFRDLLITGMPEQKTARVVVTIRTGEWKEYLEAMRLGAFDAVQCPLREADVEAIISRAMHEDRSTSERMIA